MARSYDTVIFDIGNVLMRFSWDVWAEVRFGAETNRVLRRAIWYSGWWNELDRGVLPVEDVIGGAASQVPEYEREVRAAFAEVGGACFRHSYAIPWIEEIRSMGYRTLFLSNYSGYLMDLRPDVLDFLPHLDGGLFSYRVGMTKPDPAIYRRMASDFDLDLSRCLFIDDNRVNAALARRTGLDTYCFSGYESSRGPIMELLRR